MNETTNDNKHYRLLDDLVKEVVSDLQKQGDACDVITTGLTDLDHFLDGGLRRGSVTAVAARPCMGRSQFVWGIAQSAAASGHGVLLFTSCTSPYRFVKSGIGHVIGIEPWRLRRRRGTVCGFNSILIEKTQELAAFGKLPILIDDTPSLSPECLCERISKLCYDKPLPGMTIDIVIIDGLELLRMADDSQDEALLASTAMLSLTATAKANDLQVLVTVPVLRQVEEREIKIPELRDLWGKGIIEKTSDLVIAIYRDECYNFEPDIRTGVATLFVLRNRQGSTGSITSRFEDGRFTNAVS